MNIWIIGNKLMKPLNLIKDFYNQLNMDDITDAGYAHAKAFCQDFKNKKYSGML